MGAFTKIFQRLRLTSDSNVATQTTAVIQADTTNSSIAIVPNGTGAIIAAIPDGTATGGNARGTNAVDLQQSRGAATNVASGGYSVISGGQSNISSVGYSTVLGGLSNNSSGIYSISGGNSCISGGNSSISLGASNNTPSNFSTISGGSGNTASSNYSTISGGQSNTASTNTHATVVGGSTNTSSGQYSVSGGQSNTASGGNSVAFGQLAVSSGAGSVSLGTGNQSTGANSICVGYGGVSHLIRSFTIGNSGGISPYAGAVQQTYLTPYREATLTTAATLVLSLDGTGTTNLIIPNGNNRAWNVQIDTIAVVTAITGTATGVSVGDCYRETKQLLFKRIGGTSSIVGSVDTSAIKSDTSMSTAAITVTAGASQQMALTFTAPTFAGGGSVTCRVVSKVSLVEVAY